MRKLILPVVLLVAIVGKFPNLASCWGGDGSSAQTPPFTRQFGTGGDDWANGITVQADGGVAVTGLTTGVLETGHVPVPGGECFLARFDASGKILWARQFSPGVGYGVTVDPAGNLYVVGTAGGDVLVARFDPAGNRLWQFLGGSPQTDSGEAITVGPDNAVYVTGRTGGDFEPGGRNRGGTDIFVAKFTPNDNVPVWIRQIGSQGQDFVEAIAVDDNGAVYVAGMSQGDFEGNTWNGAEDVVLAKLSAVDGTAAWARQYGTPDDEYGSGVAIDGNGNVYVLGYTDADIDNTGVPADGIDLFLMKIDPGSGVRAWTVQKRTPGKDQAEGLSYRDGRLVAAGFTEGAFGGQNAGLTDAFLASYSLSGTPLWTLQMGTASSEEIWWLAAGGDGNWYSAGSTTGLLRTGEASAGGRDAFLLKVDSSGTPR